MSLHTSPSLPGFNRELMYSIHLPALEIYIALVKGKDGEHMTEVAVKGAKGLEWIKGEDLCSVWLRPDGRRMASVARGLSVCCVVSAGRNAHLFFTLSVSRDSEDCDITVD